MNQEEKNEKQQDHPHEKISEYVVNQMIDTMQYISEKGSIKEKLLGIAISALLDAAMENKTRNPESTTGIDNVLEALKDIMIKNNTISEKYIDKSDYCLLDMGLVNMTGLMNAYYSGDMHSQHIYHSLLNKDHNFPDQESLKNKNQDIIAGKITEINKMIGDKEITPEQGIAEIKKFIEDLSSSSGDNIKVEIIEGDTSHRPSLKNRFAEDLYKLWIRYHTIISKKKDLEKNDPNVFYAVNILKALLMVTKLGLSVEMAAHLSKSGNFYDEVTSMMNKVIKESEMTVDEFFSCSEYTEAEMAQMLKETLENPDIDKEVKDLLGGINLN